MIITIIIGIKPATVEEEKSVDLSDAIANDGDKKVRENISVVLFKDIVKLT